MSRIMCASTPRVKPVRKSPRPAAPFGAGIFPARRQRFEPTAEERAWAAAEFSDYDGWEGRLIAGLEACICEACSRPVRSGELHHGLCDVCESAAEDASMASLYGSAGLGFCSH